MNGATYTLEGLVVGDHIAAANVESVMGVGAVQDLEELLSDVVAASHSLRVRIMERFTPLWRRPSKWRSHQGTH